MSRGEMPEEIVYYTAQLRIPTKEPYAYIEVTVEDTAEGILEAYKEFTSLQEAPGTPQGLSDKDMNSAVDEYLTTNTLKDGANIAEKMSPSQKEWFQVTKRAFKRLKAKHE